MDFKKVDLFIPCFIDQLYPETAMNTLKVLEHLGIEVHYNTNQTCCGQMAFNSGFWDDARDLGEKMINDFNTGRVVVSPSASCVGMVRNYYSDLFHNTSMHLECKNLQGRIFEFSDFLVNQLGITDIGAKMDTTITYHDACAALREYGIKSEPRTLLDNVKGLTIIEMERTDVCCGFGGTFSVKHEPISTAMAQQKVEHALATGAEYIVSTEGSCLLNLQGYIKKHKLNIKTKHIADILAEGIS